MTIDLQWFATTSGTKSENVKEITPKFNILRDLKGESCIDFNAFLVNFSFRGMCKYDGISGRNVIFKGIFVQFPDFLRQNG